MKKYELDYHVKQMEHIYRSTEIFVNWLEERGIMGNGQQLKVLDMACGTGANTIYMANRFRESQFVGMDINEEFIDYGNSQMEKYSQHRNCNLYKGDWFQPAKQWIGAFDGVISFQTLMMFPDYREALRKLAELHTKWIAVSSLFYEGDIEYTNKFRDYYRPSEGREYTDIYYNIHSIPRFKEYVSELGYTKFDYIPFDIDIDLPKTENLDIETYTVRTEEGKRIQISAGMMMPWYFAVAHK